MRCLNVFPECWGKCSILPDNPLLPLFISNPVPFKPWALLLGHKTQPCKMSFLLSRTRSVFFVIIEPDQSWHPQAWCLPRSLFLYHNCGHYLWVNSIILMKDTGVLCKNLDVSLSYKCCTLGVELTVIRKGFLFVVVLFCFLIVCFLLFQNMCCV